MECSCDYNDMLAQLDIFKKDLNIEIKKLQEIEEQEAKNREQIRIENINPLELIQNTSDELHDKILKEFAWNFAHRVENYIADNIRGLHRNWPTRSNFKDYVNARYVDKTSNRYTLDFSKKFKLYPEDIVSNKILHLRENEDVALFSKVRIDLSQETTFSYINKNEVVLGDEIIGITESILYDYGLDQRSIWEDLSSVLTS